MTDEPQGEDNLAVLMMKATELMDHVEALARDGGRQFTVLADRAKSNRQLGVAARRLGVVALTGLILDILLTVIVSIGLTEVRSQEEELSSLTRQLDISQTTQRQKALCPLYHILLNLKPSNDHKSTADSERYKRALAVINDSYTALSCSSYIDHPAVVVPGSSGE